jgi:hypothetical protein
MIGFVVFNYMTTDSSHPAVIERKCGVHVKILETI